jgi:hypothetical protein
MGKNIRRVYHKRESGFNHRLPETVVISNSGHEALGEHPSFQEHHPYFAVGYTEDAFLCLKRHPLCRSRNFNGSGKIHGKRHMHDQFPNVVDEARHKEIMTRLFQFGADDLCPKPAHK